MVAGAAVVSASFDFGGRVVLVTGAAQGIGLALARAFAADGAVLAVLDSDADQLRAQWPASDRVLPHAVDVADAEAVAAAVEAVATSTGRVDVAVNNAGVTRDAVVWRMTDEQWQTVLGVHLTGTFAVTRAVLPHMRAARYGRIVNVTSYSGLHGNVGQSNYAAAKAGIVGFTKAVAKEVARSGITVNAVSPNAATSMVAAVPPARLAELREAIPMGRFADPAEMTAAVRFLACEGAAYVTGTVLPVDGGMSM